MKTCFPPAAAFARRRTRSAVVGSSWVVCLTAHLLGVLVLSGCASSKQYVAVPPNAGQATTDPDSARVYVIRPGGVFGAAAAWDVQEGKRIVGSVGPGGYLVWDRPPGEVFITHPGYYGDPVRFVAEKGRTYYLKWEMGINASDMALLDDQEGQALLKQYAKGPKYKAP